MRTETRMPRSKRKWLCDRTVGEAKNTALEMRILFILATYDRFAKASQQVRLQHFICRCLTKRYVQTLAIHSQRRHRVTWFSSLVTSSDLLYLGSTDTNIRRSRCRTFTGRR